MFKAFNGLFPAIVPPPPPSRGYDADTKAFN